MDSIKPHILIVEDEYFLYESLKRLLEKEGFTVSDYCPSVDDALLEIQKHKPDLALLDIRLQGDKTGIDLGGELRRVYHIPFIYITEFGDRHTFNRALQTTPEFFLVKTKPVLDEKLLLNNIEAILFRYSNGGKQLHPRGIMGLLEYKNELRDYGSKKISKVPVAFSDIVFFSKDYFINENGEKEEVKVNYSWFLKSNGEHFFIKKSLEKLQQILPYNFVRINGKYIINLTSEKFTGRINGVTIKVWDREIKISSTYRDNFLERLNHFYPE